MTEKITDELAPETVSQRKSQTGRPENNVTAPADPSYRSRNQITEKITDGQVEKHPGNSVAVPEDPGQKIF